MIGLTFSTSQQIADIWQSLRHSGLARRLHQTWL